MLALRVPDETQGATVYPGQRLRGLYSTNPILQGRLKGQQAAGIDGSAWEGLFDSSHGHGVESG